MVDWEGTFPLVIYLCLRTVIFYCQMSSYGEIGFLNGSNLLMTLREANYKWPKPCKYSLGKLQKCL